MALFGKKKEGAQTRHKHPANTEPRIVGINGLGMKTRDIVGEAIFLEKTLKLRVAAEGNTTLGHQIRYDCGPLQLELVEGGVSWALQPKTRLGFPDVPVVPSFLVDNISTIAKNLHDLEIPATQVFDQGWASNLLFFDPERNLWQIAETHNRPPVGTNELHYLGVIWLAVENLKEQIAFYHEVLGLPLVDQGGVERPITERAEREQAEFGQEPPTEETEPEKPALNMGAAFFKKGARLALSPGGKKPENGEARVWGRDNAFQINFQAVNLKALARRLTEQNIPIKGPYEDPTSARWLYVTDPEGNVSRVMEYFNQPVK